MSVHVPHALSTIALGGLLLLSACEAPIEVDAAGDATATQAVTDEAAATGDDRRRPLPPPGRCRPPLTAEAAAQGPGPHGPHGHRGPPPAGDQLAGTPGQPGARPEPPAGGDRGPPPGHPHHGPGGDRLLAVYDDNDDGRLDDAERAARDADIATACTARNAEAIAAFDADGDTLLNVEEWAAAREAHHAEHRAAHAARNGRPGDDDIAVATWDVDSDGVLSPSERTALKKTLRTMVCEGLRLPRLPTQLTQMASNEENP